MEYPPPLDRTISRFLRLLVGIARAEIDFAVVGGPAVCLIAYVRYSADAGILIRQQPEIAARLLAVLCRWGAGWTLDDFRPRLRFFAAHGGRIPCLAPEDLIALKQDSWRGKDKLDVLAWREILQRNPS